MRATQYIKKRTAVRHAWKNRVQIRIELVRTA